MDFSHYSGFIFFMFIFTAGFWLLIFALTVIVPYWLFGAWIEMYKEYRENKSNKVVKDEMNEEAVL